MGQCCSDPVDTPTKSKRYLDAKDNTTAGVVSKGGNVNGVTKNGKKKGNGNDDEDDMGGDDDGRTHSAPTSPVTGHKQRVAPHSNPDPPRAKTRAQGIAGTTPAGGKAKHGHGRGAAPTEKRRRVMQRNLSHVSLSSPRKAENSTSSRSGTGDKNSFLRPSASNTLGSANFKPSSRAPQFSDAEITALRGLAVERGDKEAAMLRLAFTSNGSASNDGGSPPNGMLSPAGGTGGGTSLIAVSMSLQDFQSWLLDSDEHPRDHYDAPSPLSSPLAAGLHGLTSVGGSVVPALTLPEALMQCFYIQQLFIDAQVNVGNGDVPHSRFGFADFLKLISLALATSEQLLLFAFRALDTDEDGVIDNDDISFLARALASIRIPPEWGIAETSHAPPTYHNNHNYYNNHHHFSNIKDSTNTRMSTTNRTAAASSTITATPTTAAVAEVTETDGDRGSPPTVTMDEKTNSPNPGSPTTSPRPYYIHLPPEAKASQPVSDLMGPLINVVVEYAQNRREREQRYSVYPGNAAATIPTDVNSEMGSSVSSGSGSRDNGKIAISLSDFSQLCKQFDWILAPVRRLQQVIRHKTLSEEAWVRLMAVRDRSKLDSPSSLHPINNPPTMPPPLTMGASAVPTSQSSSSSSSSATHQQIHINDNGMATVTVTGLTISTGASKDWPAPLMPPYVTPPGTSAPRILPGLAAVSMPAAEMVSHISHNSLSHIMTSASAPNSSTDVVADHATAAILPGTLNGSSHDNH